MAAALSTPTSGRPGAQLGARVAPSALRLPVLGLALLVAACSNPTVAGVGESLSSGFDRLWSPFMGPTTVVASNSLTVQRVRGANPAVEPLVPESGNVWPDEEAPRPTLMSGPDEAMRNIPEYRPSLIQGSPPASSPVPTPGDRPVVRRGSSTPPGTPGAPGEFARNPATPAPPGSQSPPPPRTEGQALTTPSGRAVIGTGGTPRVQGVTGPQGGGAVVRDGNVETWIGPDGRTSTRIVPN